MGAGASAQFGPALDACAARPADGSDLRDFNTAKAEAVQLRRTLAALRYQVNAQGQGATACFEHLHERMQQWTRYSPEQSCLIATALAGNPDAVIHLPGLPFSVRCGRNATSQGMPVPPDSGLLQVNNNSGACRIVRVALGTAPAYAQKTASGTFQPLTPAQNALIASAVATAPHGGAKAVGPGFEIRWGTNATTPTYPQPPHTGLILVGPRGGSTVIRGQWGPLPVFAGGPRGPSMPPAYGGGGGAPRYVPQQGGHPFAGGGGPGFVGPVPGQRPGGVVPGQAPRGPAPGQQPGQQPGAPPVGREPQASGGLGVGGAVAAGVVGGAVGAGVVMAATNPGAVVDGANAASQWAGQNIASDAQVIGAANDVAQWTTGAGNDIGQWTSGAAQDVGQWGSNVVAPGIVDAAQATGGAFATAGDWTAGAAGDVGQWSSNVAAPGIVDAAQATGGAFAVAGDWTAGAAVDSGQAIGGFAVNATDATGDAFATAGQWTAGAAVDSGQAIGGFAVDAGQAIGDVGGDIGGGIVDAAQAFGSALGF